MMSATKGALMGFDEWSAQQVQQGDAQRAAQDERQARELAEAERIITDLEEELRSVVPHLAAFPRVAVGEQRVDIDSSTHTAAVTGIGPATNAWEFPPAAGGQPRYWVDVHGRLWHEAFALITFERPKQTFMIAKPGPIASAHVCMPFNMKMVRRQRQARGTRSITMDVKVDGQRIPPGSTLAEAGHAEFELIERLEINFFDVGGAGSAPVDSLDGLQDIGWPTYDSHPTLVRDDVFKRVRAALDRGATTL
jgi:hypothetical protein